MERSEVCAFSLWSGRLGARWEEIFFLDVPQARHSGSATAALSLEFFHL